MTGIVGASSTFVSMLVVDKLGRRALFTIGGIQMFISQVLVGGIMAGELGDHGGIGKGSAYSVLVLICVYVAGFGWSWGPSTGDSISWAKHYGGSELCLHFHSCSDISCYALSLQGRDLLLFWWMGGGDDCVYVLAIAGD
jgi:hypothetical protein